jgi:hypothetical protein
MAPVSHFSDRLRITSLRGQHAQNYRDFRDFARNRQRSPGEFEHQWSGEGELYFLEYARVNGQPYSTSAQTFHQLQQSSLRMVWQFRDNAWVHPYVSAGAVVDFERQHYYVPPIYTAGVRDPVLLRNAVDSGHRTELRGGWTIGGGAKFYMTEKAFFNTGVIGTFTMPRAKSVSVIAGFGIDF